MSLSIVEIFNLIQTGIQVCKDLRSLFEVSRRDIEHQQGGDRWATYINPIHSLKISWPSQRWSFSECGNVTPEICYPILLNFKMSEPILVASAKGQGKSDEVVPNIAVLIEKNGGIPMDIYLKMMNDNYVAMYGLAGAQVVQDMLGKKVTPDEALVAFHAIFPKVNLWHINNIKRFEDRMYVVRGLIIESKSSSSFDLALSDLPKIMNSITILGSNK
jgi:hypothetical protein